MPAPSSDGSSENPVPGMTPQTLTIVRLAMLSMVVLFGLIAWYLSSSGQVSAADESVATILRYLFLGLLATTLVAVSLIRQRADRAESFARRAGLLMVGYALAEALALFGAVYLLMTGSTVFFITGLVLFVATLFFLPVQPAADR